MAMRSQSFYSAMSKYYGAIGVTKKPYVVKKPDYPDFIDGIDCVMKMDNAKQHRFKKAEAKTKKINKIINALLIVNFLIFIAFVLEAYFYPFFIVTHFLILGSGLLNTTVLKKRREKKIQLAFRFTWFS